MKSYKALYFYNKIDEKELIKISKLYSNKNEFYTLDNQIVLFNFLPDTYLLHQSELKVYLKKALILIMTDFKYLDLLSNSKTLSFKFIDAKFETQSGDVLSEDSTYKFINDIKERNFLELTKELKKEELRFRTVKLSLNTQIEINKYGTVWLPKRVKSINQILAIINFLFKGKVL